MFLLRETEPETERGQWVFVFLALETKQFCRDRIGLDWVQNLLENYWPTFELKLFETSAQHSWQIYKL
ncbi:hypothetical protein GBA52_009404 [Prunus armeniaca]|nr:hypothetical protein GBA52_009404 [Prunus armeniaca]